MKARHTLLPLAAVCGLLLARPEATEAGPPATFDLRNVNGVSYVTFVKNQQGGTCWTHGTMAAIEGNLLMSGAWTAAGEEGDPNLAEYHLDWWNGFNQYNNDDLVPPTYNGLAVHEGGDYRVAAAYLSRGEGAARECDGQSFSSAPPRLGAGFHRFYVRDIEWYTALPDLSRIGLIKEKLMTHGALGTCMAYDSGFMSSYIHYQPPSSSMLPNHAITIIGWDDNKATQAPQGPGAWLCKNSWNNGWGEDGFFWISYYDKWCCQEPEMGAVSLYNVEPLSYSRFYYHDYHGWRDTLPAISEAFNAFVATDEEPLSAVSFYTAANNVTWTARVYDDFDGTQLQNELAVQTGFCQYSGFHTIDLDTPVHLLSGDDFYVYLSVDSGGQAIDRTSDVPVLLGAAYRTIVDSTAAAGQSYYRSGQQWLDLYNYVFTNPTWNQTANFCIKALTRPYRAVVIELPEGPPTHLAPGVPTHFAVRIRPEMETVVLSYSRLFYSFDGTNFQWVPLTPLGNELYDAALPPAACAQALAFFVHARGDAGTLVLLPEGAPQTCFHAAVGTPVVLFTDDFESNLGWVAENLGASSGQWQRGVPVNDPDWSYDPYTDGDGSGQCYLTQNTLGNTDVDNGAVRLTSPLIDMSAGGVTISFDYYLHLTQETAIAPAPDMLLVEINSTGGSGTWTEIARLGAGGGWNWYRHTITPADLAAAGVTYTANMKLRFTVNDGNPQTIVEAGLDGIEITGVQCTEPTVCAGDANCDGVISWRDIDFFVAAMNDDYAAWDALFAPGHATCVFANNDVNGDGTVNWRDIDPLVAVMNTVCP